MSIDVGGIMKTIMHITLVCLLAVGQGIARDEWNVEVVVQKAEGEVNVRPNVTEEWVKVKVGQSLRPHDTMRTGKKSSATLSVRMGDGAKTISLPADVVVDISDIRHLSQEELMLKLTMQKVRSSSYDWKTKEMNIPNAAVLHGTDKGGTPEVVENDPETGRLQLNGVRVLLDNGFYSTSALRAMDVMQRFPSLSSSFEHRLLVAEALERAHLKGEALSEYVSLLSSGGLTPAQESLVSERVRILRKATGQ
jgi:hypothetical protein